MVRRQKLDGKIKCLAVDSSFGLGGAELAEVENEATREYMRKLASELNSRGIPELRRFGGEGEGRGAIGLFLLDGRLLGVGEEGSGELRGLGRGNGLFGAAGTFIQAFHFL